MCKYCNTKLKLGDFAYNQDMCWECFKKEVYFLMDAIDTPSWFEGKRELHIDILKHLFNITAEMFYGREWKIKISQNPTWDDMKNIRDVNMVYNEL